MRKLAPEFGARARALAPQTFLCCSQPRTRLAYRMAEPDLPSSCSPAVALKLGAAQAYMQAWWQGVARVTALWKAAI